MKKGLATIMVLVSFGNMYDIVLILNGTYLPPFSISLIGDVSTRAYLIYKITTVIAILFVAFKIFNPEMVEKNQSTHRDG